MFVQSNRYQHSESTLFIYLASHCQTLLCIAIVEEQSVKTVIQYYDTTRRKQYYETTHLKRSTTTLRNSSIETVLLYYETTQLKQYEYYETTELIQNYDLQTAVDATFTALLLVHGHKELLEGLLWRVFGGHNLHNFVRRRWLHERSYTNLSDLQGSRNHQHDELL